MNPIQLNNISKMSCNHEEGVASSIEMNEARQETSFADLPDEILSKIIAPLDLPNRLKLRGTKRLNHFIMANTKIEKIDISFCRDSSDTLIAKLEASYFPTAHSTSTHTSLESMTLSLHTLARHNSIGEMRINVRTTSSKQLRDVLDSLYNMPVDQMYFDDGLGGYVRRRDFEDMDFPTLLIAAQKNSEITINKTCPYINAIDLCILRKNMLAGGCQLESFSVLVTDEVVKSFHRTCFGLTIEEEISEDSVMRMFYSNNEDEQFYSTDFHFPEKLVHFEDDIMSTIQRNCISFQKIAKEEKLGLIENMHHVQIAFPYMKFC